MNFLLRSQQYKCCLRRVPEMQIKNKSTSASGTSAVADLPKLPVPRLEDTLEKYLRSVRPFLNAEQFRESSRLAKEFLDPSGTGVQLQKLLLKKAENETNWLSKWWLECAYLKFRETVVVHSSPGLVFPPIEHSGDHDDGYLKYATKLVFGAIRFKHLIDRNLLPADKLGKELLDMSQYSKIFGTCRVPVKDCDRLEFHPDSNHIVVAYKSNFFKIKIFDKSNNCLSENQLFKQLKHITKTYATTKAVPIGILTSLNRDDWSEAFLELSKGIDNIKSIEEIQKSLFLLCLDENLDDRFGKTKQNVAAHQTIHGGGEHFNSSNRWFDKTLQLIVSKNGISGLTYEHSPSEGQPIAVLTDYLINFAKNNDFEYDDNENLEQNIEVLKFVDVNKNPTLLKMVNKANDHINKLSSDLDMECFTFDKFGKDVIKSVKLSPDSFIQMAMQYAFYKVHKEPAAHYESAATRKYVGGRTETIRSCSIESVDFAIKMCSSKGTFSDIEKIAAMKSAIDSHKKYTISAINGFGVDRHLLGLKLIAFENDYKLPELYEDESFKRSTHMRISSSQVATKCNGFMCYGPLVHDGYGCCYNPRDSDINFAISSFRSNPDTKSIAYKNALIECLNTMIGLMLENQLKHKL